MTVYERVTERQREDQRSRDSRNGDRSVWIILTTAKRAHGRGVPPHIEVLASTGDVYQESMGLKPPLARRQRTLVSLIYLYHSRICDGRPELGDPTRDAQAKDGDLRLLKRGQAVAAPVHGFVRASRFQGDFKRASGRGRLQVPWLWQEVKGGVETSPLLHPLPCCASQPNPCRLAPAVTL